MIVLANIIAIFRKELQSYFASPLAYLVAGAFWLLSGIAFVSLLFSLLQEVAASEQVGLSTPPVDVPYIFLIRFLSIIGSITSFVLPVLSMGLYAEERKRRTLELLATSPLTNWTVAVGKLLGVVTFYLTLLIPILICEAIAFSTAQPPVPLAVPLLGHFGLILLGTAILALGMFISSLTESSMIAAIMTFALVLLLGLLDLVTDRLPQPFGAALGHFSMIKHYDKLVQGIFDTSSLIVFASYIFLGIFLTAQSIEALRFQRS